MVRSKVDGISPSKSAVPQNVTALQVKPQLPLSVFQSGDYTKLGSSVDTKTLAVLYSSASQKSQQCSQLYSAASTFNNTNVPSPSRLTNGIYNSKHSIQQKNKIGNSPQKSPYKSNYPVGQTYYHISRMKALPALYRKMFGVFREGCEVLARWSDGLYYLGTVHKVEDLKHQCSVQFEDKSISAVHFKDMQLLNNGKGEEGHEEEGVTPESELESDVTCTLCRDGNSEAPNEIVLCDKCGQGYHQLCHAPSIDTSVLYEEDVPWQCRTCVFAAGAKRGGAEPEGPAALALKLMKQVLPYDNHSLTWCKGHKVNSEEVYCYCGGPGDWYLKMLQCCRCQQWFHEACIQCLDTPILYGDRFYIFVCSLCNHGEEFVKRLPMRCIFFTMFRNRRHPFYCLDTRVDVVHLVLYNITIAKTVKYYDFHAAIMPFFPQNWESLQLGELVHEASTRSQLKERVLETLQNNKTRFQCGSESKKAKMSWGLRTRSPPVPPTVTVPACGVINDELLASMDLRHGSVLLSDSPTPLKRSAPGDLGCSPISKKRRDSSLECDVILPPHDNIFDRLSFDSRQSSVRSSETSNSFDEKPKRRRGRPRKEKTIQNLSVHSRRGRPCGSVKPKPKERSRKSSFSSETSGGLPLVDLFQETASNPDSEPIHTSRESNEKDLRRTVARYFGAEGRMACGERYRVLAKRVVPDTDNIRPKVEYLIEWKGYTAKQLHESTKFR